jgi:hypothetical protein
MVFSVILIDHTSKSTVNSILNISKPQAFFIDPHLKTAWAIEHANCIKRGKCAGKKIFNKILLKKVIQGAIEDVQSNRYPSCIETIETKFQNILQQLISRPLRTLYIPQAPLLTPKESQFRTIIYSATYKR